MSELSKRRLSGDGMRAMILSNSQRLLSDEFREEDLSIESKADSNIQTKNKSLDCRFGFMSDKIFSSDKQSLIIGK